MNLNRAEFKFITVFIRWTICSLQFVFRTISRLISSDFFSCITK